MFFFMLFWRMYGLVSVVSCVFVVWICGSICYGILSLSSSYILCVVFCVVSSFPFLILHKHLYFTFWLYVVLLLAVCCCSTITWTQSFVFCTFVSCILYIFLKSSRSFFILVLVSLSLCFFLRFLWLLLYVELFCCFYERDVRSRDSSVWSFKVFRIYFHLKFIIFILYFLVFVVFFLI